MPKASRLLALPVAVRTVTVPLVKPAGTVAVSCVAEPAWNWAMTPLNVTAAVVLRLNPVIVTTVPAGPLIGHNDVTDGPIVSAVVLTASAVPRTDTGPLNASFGTVAVICVGETTVKVAFAVEPVNPTELTEVRLVPVIVTSAPGEAVVGVKELIVGGAAKSALAVAVPEGAVMLIGPLMRLAGTIALMVVADTTLNDAAGVAPKQTAVAPDRFAPVIVTAVPAAPRAGEKLLIAADATANVPVATPVLTGVSTEIRPETAFAGTATVIDVADTVVGLIATPANFTAVAPVKFAPVIVKLVPVAPDAGLNDATAGDVVTKHVSLVMRVVLDTIAIGPLVAPPGTAVVISVGDTTLNEETDVPLNFTSVTSAKLVPVMYTLAPSAPVVGSKRRLLAVELAHETGATKVPERPPTVLVITTTASANTATATPAPIPTLRILRCSARDFDDHEKRERVASLLAGAGESTASFVILFGVFMRAALLRCSEVGAAHTAIRDNEPACAWFFGSSRRDRAVDDRRPDG